MKEGESYWGSLSLGSLVVMLNIVTAFINLKRKYIPVHVPVLVNCRFQVKMTRTRERSQWWWHTPCLCCWWSSDTPLTWGWWRPTDPDWWPWVRRVRLSSVSRTMMCYYASITSWRMFHSVCRDSLKQFLWKMYMYMYICFGSPYKIKKLKKTRFFM